MNKIIFTIFFFWIIWKVLKSILEEVQKRMEDEGSMKREDVTRETATQRYEQLQTPRSATRAAESAREPEEWHAGQPIPGQEESELERWFREAAEDKQEMEETAVPPPRARERAPAAPPRRRPTQPRAPARRAEPRVVHPREKQVERRRVVHARGPAVPEPEPKRREAPPAAPGRRKQRERRECADGRKPAFAEMAGFGKLDLDDVRRGIILAEILGPPKGLGDIDSHVI